MLVCACCLYPANPGWCSSCVCIGLAFTQPIPAGVLGRVCFLCALRLYPSNPGWGVPCGCVCVGSRSGYAPPVLVGVFVIVCLCARSAPTPPLLVVVCDVCVAWRLAPSPPPWLVACCVCGTQWPLLLRTFPCALVVAGGVPLWRAAWPRVVRCASSGPVALGALVGFPDAVVPFCILCADLLGGCAAHVEAGREPGSWGLPLAHAEAGMQSSLRVVPVRGPAMGLSLAVSSVNGLGLHVLRWYNVCDPITDAFGYPYRSSFNRDLGLCIGAALCENQHFPLRFAGRHAWVPCVCACACSLLPGQAGRPPGCVMVRLSFRIALLATCFAQPPPGWGCPLPVVLFAFLRFFVVFFVLFFRAPAVPGVLRLPALGALRLGTLPCDFFQPHRFFCAPLSPAFSGFRVGCPGPWRCAVSFRTPPFLVCLAAVFTFCGFYLRGPRPPWFAIYFPSPSFSSFAFPPFFCVSRQFFFPPRFSFCRSSCCSALPVLLCCCTVCCLSCCGVPPCCVVGFCALWGVLWCGFPCVVLCCVVLLVGAVYCAASLCLSFCLPSFVSLLFFLPFSFSALAVSGVPRVPVFGALRLGTLPCDIFHPHCFFCAPPSPAFSGFQPQGVVSLGAFRFPSGPPPLWFFPLRFLLSAGFRGPQPPWFAICFPPPSFSSFAFPPFFCVSRRFFFASVFVFSGVLLLPIPVLMCCCTLCCLLCCGDPPGCVVGFCALCGVL